MLLKKIYRKNGDDRGSAELDYLSIGHTGTTPEQNFSVKLVTDLVTQGIVVIDGNQLTVDAHPEDLVYTIKREPGRYCLHCGEKLPDDASGQMARLHVALKHNGLELPGYEMINHFECVLNAEQHERFKAPMPGRAPQFPRKEV